MILPGFGSRPVDGIKPSDVALWLTGLDRAPATRAMALRILFLVLDVARADGAFKVNPAADVKPPKVGRSQKGRALTDDELRAVLESAELVDHRTAAMVWLMARCGLRIGEAIALNRSDTDFGAGTITVARSMSRRDGVQPLKGRQAGDTRTIPMPPHTADRLRGHLGSQTINTVILEATLENVLILGLLVLIRTFLSWSLELEMDGRWPWQAPIGSDRESARP